MSRQRCFQSFSRQRASTCRTGGGVPGGSAVQSGDRSRTAAIVSEIVAPGEHPAASDHLKQQAAERPDIGAAIDRLPRACSGLI